MDRCKLEIWGNEADYRTRTEMFEWIFQTLSIQNTDNSSFISSDPSGVCLCISNKPDCNIAKQVTVFPGGTLHVSAVAVGQGIGTVPSVITAKFIDTGTVIDSIQGVQSADKTCTTLEYRYHQ